MIYMSITIGHRYFKFFIYLFIYFLKWNISMYFWESWNLLYRQDWFQTQRSVCLCLLISGIKQLFRKGIIWRTICLAIVIRNACFMSFNKCRVRCVLYCSIFFSLPCVPYKSLTLLLPRFYLNGIYLKLCSN